MLRFRSLDLQSANIHLDLMGYRESASVRKVDHVMPGAAGREAGTRRKDIYRFSLDGSVTGTGADRDERALSWRIATDLLMEVMDFSLDPGLVELGPEPPTMFPDSSPYLGLTLDRFLNATCVSMVRGPVLNHMSHQGWSFEMECVDSPPEWQDAES